jgi:hypothetical protein
VRGRVTATFPDGAGPRYLVLVRLVILASALILVVAGCAGSDEEPLVERRPDVWGWAVEYGYSDDFRYQDDALRDGTVELSMAGGETVTVTEDTNVIRRCGRLLGPEAWPPCWAYVGLADDARTAEWLYGFSIDGWPREGPYVLADLIDDLTVHANGYLVAYELPGELVLSNGIVVPFDRANVSLNCADGTTMDRALSGYGKTGYIGITLDPWTGQTTELACIPHID